ncbi:24-hydroxycholesterol 7-alpha-hydroxylase-like isoform X1 [Mytilus californianus]|uniref:24-hydroxycholesterol 7-alpha-hydroxylase-like isoform X1 n=1 Tax=Mytilus californianus TaxID=6549 RepID=UPI0022474FEF|nr:24-hydroxycholesterol 7-alpha-hydroxylase-like isoform X1 [Mytilus californianus]
MVLELNDLIVGLILTTIIPILYCVYHVSRSKSKSLPPAYKGWFPWLGCAFEFGKNPLDFIAQKKELGRIFTLYVAGERLTFITDAEDFQYFFQSPFVDFQKAVQDPVLNVASVSKTSFFKYHTKIHDMVKGRLASSRLIYFSDKLCDEFRDQLTQLGKQGKGDLHHLVRRSMYAAVINNLFGKNVLPVNCEKEFEKIEEMFVMFDEQFEYGARLPSVFLKDWSSAKKYLIELFSKVVQKTTNKKSDDDETLLQSLLSLVQDQYKANYSLLLLWASLANAIPITFWTLAFILHDEKVLQKLRTELTSVFGQNGQCPTVTEDGLKKLQYLKWCVLESIRLRPTGIITRRVIKSFSIRDMKIPEGDMLMLSPYWAHRNEKYFPDPLMYKPERWKEADIDKNVFLDGFVAFGGGRYQCPGRWYAILEIQMYVAMFIQMFDCKLLINSVPEPSKKHLVGTQQPAEPCPVEYRLRK